MTQTQPRGLAGLVTAIRDHWIAALVGFLVVMIPAGFLIATQKSEYKSEAVVGLLPVRSMSDSFLRTLAQQLPTYLSSPEVTAKVGAKTGMTPKEVERAVTIEVPSATLNLSISAVDGDAATAAQLANETANVALADTTYKEYFTPRMLSPAVPAERPSGLGRGVLLAAALILAVIVASVAALLARDLGSGRKAGNRGAGQPGGGETVASDRK